MEHKVKSKSTGLAPVTNWDEEVFTQRYVAELVKRLTEKDKNKRQNSELLSSDEKAYVIEYLRYNENTSTTQIATILGVGKVYVESTLYNIEKSYRTALISRGINDPVHLANEILRVKNYVQAKATLKGNLFLVWKAEQDFVKILGELGIITLYSPQKPVEGVEGSIIDPDVVPASSLSGVSSTGQVLDAEFQEEAKEVRKSKMPPKFARNPKKLISKMEQKYDFDNFDEDDKLSLGQLIEKSDMEIESLKKRRKGKNGR